jgi:DNA-binding NarL/FixJ family response regulator
MTVRIVVADDRETVRFGLRTLLEQRAGMNVVAAAADGQEAVRLVKTHRPDAVLIDVRMPVLDGLSATRLIKAQWPEVRVVVFSLSPSFRADALAAGADAFLVKGCPAAELWGALSAHS